MPEGRENTRAKKITFSIDKENNFSDWFTEIVSAAELADMRYNVKGFLVFQPWSVVCMEKMYDYYEVALQRKGHKPYWYPALIPESNFHKEKEHVKGFAPDVFWVTEYGEGEKLPEKYALRPTSETAIHQMFSIWIRSYNDLPFKTYQRAQVWRHETKATRPFLRSREFYWIEAHDAFATEEDAMKQVHEDMEIAEEVIHNVFGVPFIFFERPQWDKFAGAEKTFAADAITPDGKIIQQPSTHFLGQNFSKAFDVKFTDKNGNEKYCYLTCYGPAISRIFASVIATHGDNKGLRFPFEIAPVQFVVVPIGFDKNKRVLDKALAVCNTLRLAGYRAEVDKTTKTPGEKFYFWEMKGIPFRIEIGPKELKQKNLLVHRRDLGKKVSVKESKLIHWVGKEGWNLTENLRAEADASFKKAIVSAGTLEEMKKILGGKGIARANFCSIGMDGAKCAEVVEKDFLATVRGIRVDKKEFPSGNKKCIVCGKPAVVVVCIGRQY